MPRNLELKIKCDFFNEVKNCLEEINADYTGELNQKDIYFRVENRLLKLRIENGEQSLIKYTRDETGKDRWSDFQVIKLPDKNAEDFFEDLFDIETVVEKKRLVYIYDNTRIHLDKVKGLGEFLELETLVLNGLKDAKSRFNYMVKKLKLDLSSQIKNSYKILIEEKNR